MLFRILSFFHFLYFFLIDTPGIISINEEKYLNSYKGEGWKQFFILFFQVRVLELLPTSFAISSFPNIVIQKIQTQTLKHTQPYKSTDLTNLRASYITVLSLLFYYMYKTNLRIKCHIHDSWLINFRTSLSPSSLWYIRVQVQNG